MGATGGDGTAFSFFSFSLFPRQIFSNDSATTRVCRGVGVTAGGVNAVILCAALLLRDLLLQVGDVLATARCFSGGPKFHTTQLSLRMHETN